MNFEDTDFRLEVLDLYKKMSKFAFDHLKAIVEEHGYFPNLPLKDLVENLNLDFITGEKEIDVYKVIIDGKELIAKTTEKIRLDLFMRADISVIFNSVIISKLILERKSAATAPLNDSV